MQKIVTTLIDDMTGEEAHETVPFGLDGQQYAIDLSAGNAAALRAALGGYVDKARRVKGGASPARAPRVSRAAAAREERGEDPALIRAWLVEQGYGPENGLKERGRIPGVLVERYRNRAAAVATAPPSTSARRGGRRASESIGAQA